MTGADGALQIRDSPFRRATRTGPEPGVGRLVLGQAHAHSANHNGGQVQFDAGGLLYAGFGDGGSGNDPTATARTSTRCSAS